jgi:hypothetical protein
LVVPTIISPAGTYYEQYYPQFLLEGFPYSGVIGSNITVIAVKNVTTVYVLRKTLLKNREAGIWGKTPSDGEK